MRFAPPIVSLKKWVDPDPRGGDTDPVDYSKHIEQTTKHWDSWTVGSVVTLTMSYQQVSKKKYDEDEDFEDSEDAESDISESDFEDPDMMEVILS